MPYLPGDPAMVDLTDIGGWRDFRRVRGDARWMILRRRAFGVRGVARPNAEPLDPPVDGVAGGMMLLRDFCSDPLPRIDLADEGGATVYELGPGPVGVGGAFDLFYGSTTRALGSRFATEPAQTADFGCSISAPCEAVQADLLIHRDCGLIAAPTAALYAQLGVAGRDRHDRDRLPIAPRRVELGRYRPRIRKKARPLSPARCRP